ASKQLEALLPESKAALAKALEGKPSAEVRRRLYSLLESPSRIAGDAELLRCIRAIAVLEQIAASGVDSTRLATIDLLKKLTAGAPEARLKQEAKASLERLEKRKK